MRKQHSEQQYLRKNNYEMVKIMSDFEIVFDKTTGGVKSLVNKNDQHNMNWVEGSAVWGTIKGAELITCSQTEVGVVAKYKNNKFDIEVARKIEDNKFVETYSFINTTNAPVFIKRGELGIYTTFNDSYDSADICMTNRCNTHIWCGENTTWVNALKMGVSNINLGLILTKGSVDCYSVERNLDKMSNDRGDFILHPSAFSLEAGKSYTIEWELFFHNGKKEFEDKLLQYDILFPTAKKYTVFENESIEISVNKEASVYLDDTLIFDKVTNFSYMPQRLGEHKFIIKDENNTTIIKIFVSKSLENLVSSRVNYIIENQQCLDKDSELYGAYLVFDTKEKKQYHDSNWYDHNALRERIGMALLVAEYLKNNDSNIVRDSLEKYKKFYFEEYIDIKTGEVYNGIGHNNKDYRLYNYSWAIMFLVDLYILEKNESYLDIMVRIIKRYYDDGGSRFYPNGWFLRETLSVLKDANKIKEYNEVLELYTVHIKNMVKIGTNYPPHEVNYEQTIVTPGATMITQYMLATKTNDFLEDAKKQISVLERFNGNQPDYHQNETAIRHWDDYWFGKSKIYADTFPHYWSSLTGISFLNYFELTKDTVYLNKAEENLRNCLCLFNSDGSASCAYVYPFSANGERGEFFDEWANDQDFALYYILKYLKM